MLVKSYAAAVRGIDAIIVTVETVVEKGMQYCIVAFPTPLSRKATSAYARQ